MTAAIELEALSYWRGATEILRNVSLEIRSGEVVVLLGPSGSGKSSVVRLILGLATPRAGEIRLRGEIVSQAGRLLRAPEDRHMAAVFQDLALWPHLTVRANLAFGLRARGVAKDEREARIRETLRRVGLEGKESRYPDALSGGERQRVAIARALVMKPTAVLLDEPLTSLDVLLRDQLLGLFRDLLKERGFPVLYVTHDPREAVALGDRLAVLNGGTIVQAGTVEELRSRPAEPLVRRLLDAAPR